MTACLKIIACILATKQASDTPLFYKAGDVSKARIQIKSLDSKLTGVKELIYLIERPDTDASLQQIYLLATRAYNSKASPAVSQKVCDAAALYLFCLGERAKSLAPTMFADLSRGNRLKWNISVKIFNGDVIGLNHLALFSALGQSANKYCLDYLAVQARSRLTLDQPVVTAALYFLRAQNDDGARWFEGTQLAGRLVRSEDPKEFLLGAMILIHTETTFDFTTQFGGHGFSVIRGGSGNGFGTGVQFSASGTFKEVLSAGLKSIVLDTKRINDLRVDAFDALKVLDPAESRKVHALLKESKDKIWESFTLPADKKW